MVHKQAANSMGAQSDGFADDDPLAELARIVGFDQPVRREPVADLSMAPAPEAAGFNLEDELMGELDGYAEPTAHAPSAHSVATHAYDDRRYDDGRFVAAPEPVAAQPAAPAWQNGWQNEVRREEPRFSPQLPVEPEPEYYTEDLSYYAEPGGPVLDDAEAFRQSHQPATSESTVAFGHQVDVSTQHFVAAPAVDDVTPAFAHDAEETSFAPAYAPVAYHPRVVEEPVISLDLADELEMGMAEPFPSAPVAEAPRLRLPLANFQIAPAPARHVEPVMEPAPAVDFAPSVEAPVAPAISVERPVSQPVAPQVDVKVEPPAFDWSQVAVGPVEPVPQRSPEIALAAQAVADTPTTFSFDFAQQLAEAEDIDHRPAVTVAPSRAEPSFSAPVKASVEADPFADQEFEFQLDELDIDLSDIEPVTPRSAQPALAAPPVMLALPAEPARSFTAPEPREQRPAFAAQPSARFEPDFTTARVAQVAPVQPVPAQPVQASFAPTSAASFAPATMTEQDMGFDPAEIAEQDDMLETIAAMDVPEVPVPESRPAVVATNDFDIDLDSELATLLDEPAPAPVPQPVNLGGMASTKAPDAVSPKPAGPLDEFEAFEKALEEDFRTAMTPAAPAERANRGHIQIAGHGQGGYRKIKPYLMAGTAALLVLAGAGGIYAWVGSGAVGSLGGGEPVVIAADKTPSKIVPEDPGGKTVPNQDKAVYDRVAGNGNDVPTQPSLISSEEQPMDVVQRTLIPENLPMEGENDFLGTPVGETEDPRLLPEGQQAQAPAEQDPATIVPRKVRTMIVRPDGTLVTQEVPAEAEAATPLQTATNNGVLAAPSVANENTGNAINTVAARSVTPTADDSTAAAPATPPAATQAPVETAAASPTPSAIPSSRPAEQPVNIVGTVTDQGNLRPAQPATAADTVPQQTAAVTASPAETGATGGYGIQVASLPSQADAERSYRTLTQRFSILAGKPHEIREAAIPGKGTYYRVRILASSRDAAVQLCEQYRAAGGSCLVSR